ncbi:trm9, partial [Acrasis kona]
MLRLAAVCVSNRTLRRFSTLPFDNSHFEKEHVVDVYNTIAEHFSHTRHSPWPYVEGFLKALDHGCIVADVGCGNGRYMGCNKNINIIGSDISEVLASICSNNGYECNVSDCLNLPYKCNSFDATLSIAVIHHFSTEERRIKVLKELIRITKPGGKIIISAWSFDQLDRKGTPKYSEQDIFIPWHLQQKYRKDRTSTPVLKRYYHLFKNGELEDLLIKCGQTNFIDNVHIKDNYFVVLIK